MNPVNLSLNAVVEYVWSCKVQTMSTEHEQFFDF